MKTKNLIRSSAFFTLLLLTINISLSQTLTLYVIPSQFDRNWDSPRNLLFSTILNWYAPHKMKKHAIGHVVIELSRGEDLILTGSVLAKDSSFRQIAKQGYGFGVLFAFVGGRVEETEDLMAELGPRFESGKIAFMRYQISDDTYDRLHDYFEEYKARGYDKSYNGYNDPRSGNGAGCSKFGISFLEVAGIMDENYEKNWAADVPVPLKLIGGPITGNKVGIFKILMANRWAHKDELYIETKFYDPNLMYHWIHDEWNKEKIAQAGSIKLLNKNNALGLEFDLRNNACPTDVVFNYD